MNIIIQKKIYLYKYLNKENALKKFNKGVKYNF